MKKLLLAGATVTTLALATLAVLGGAATAQSDQVCPGTKVDVENLPATIEGVMVTLVDSNTVHFDIPEGSTVQVCVKAGSAQQGEGPEFFTLTADADITTGSGKDVSHVSVISVTTPTTTTPPPTTPPPTTTTPPPTTTTTPPPTTTTVPPTTTQPPTTTTAPPTTTTTTTPPPTTTTAPPPPPNQGPGPGPQNQPPAQTTGTAFTGAEDVLPLGALALTLLGSGGGMYVAGRRRARRTATPPRPDL